MKNIYEGHSLNEPKGPIPAKEGYLAPLMIALESRPTFHVCYTSGNLSLIFIY